MALRRLTENFRGTGNSVNQARPRSRLTTWALGAVIAIATGTVIVKAGDDPGIRQTFLEFSQPIRRTVQQNVVQPIQARLPAGFRRNDATRSHAAAPTALPRYAPTSREEIRHVGLTMPTQELRLPDGVLPGANRPSQPKPRYSRNVTQAEPGLETATNYCVRLCDGFAFPVGRAGIGDEDAQEAACRLACPSAPVALYTMPRGAKDFSEATRGGASYSALPTAFQYRERYSDACICRPKGQTQSSLALLTDFTLRRGDLAMTRIGIRHFDGSPKFPHRANDFTDAMKRVTDPRDRQRIRGMEAASVRGLLPVEAQASLRDRVTQEIRQAETKAAGSRQVSELPRATQRLEELAPRRASAPAPVRVIETRQRLVAMN
jgi:hypothetical protein